jgi:uncharacterized membrane protein YeaQ/YmgE (transglycosylase-associated protein family)
MELIVLILAFLLAGLIIGALARLIVPGTGGMGLLSTVFAGIAGSVLGGLVTHYLVDPREDWVEIAIAIGCAALVVAFLAPGRR